LTGRTRAELLADLPRQLRLVASEFDAFDIHLLAAGELPMRASGRSKVAAADTVMLAVWGNFVQRTVGQSRRRRARGSMPPGALRRWAAVVDDVGGLHNACELAGEHEEVGERSLELRGWGVGQCHFTDGVTRDCDWGVNDWMSLSRASSRSRSLASAERPRMCLAGDENGNILLGIRTGSRARTCSP
jgi:hypothetical protein